ncbi:MAG: DUF11 domain-containing protein, partial [Chloroflexi bacterium]|nr:DUF11 domain-containing protein [Chloroflexota bacterium]
YASGPLRGDLAKAALLSGCTDLNYDVFSQGAGSVNASQAIRSIFGGGGVAVVSDDLDLLQQPYSFGNRWEPGDYRGEEYPAFARVMEPGQTDSTTIAVTAAITATDQVVARDVELKLIEQQEFTFEVTPEMVDGEYAYGSDNRDNFFKAFQYMIPLTAVAGKDSSWYNIAVPKDTDLMVVRMLYPFEQYDANGDYAYDNRYSLMVYNWTDVNNDGDVWDDLNGNGTVNFINRQPDADFPDWDLIDGGMELVWDDPRTELDQYEFARFSYHRPGSNRLEMWVSNPLERMADGLFIGLRHTPTSNYDGPTQFVGRVEFYSEQDCPWLRLSSAAGNAGLEPNEVYLNLSTELGQVLTAHAEPPADMHPGIYQAAVEIEVPYSDLLIKGTTQGGLNTIVIPVAMTVVHPVTTVGTPEWTLGGYETYTDAYNAGRPYNNGCVRGQYDWTWREESGDWRFFYQDFASADLDSAGSTEYMIVRDQWSEPAPHNDIDTVILGPQPSRLEGDNDWFTWQEPDYYGPYVLETIAQSPIDRVDRAVWRFNTSSGANEDWLGAPIGKGGLHAILQHHVLADGLSFDVVFTKTLGLMTVGPDSFVDVTYKDDGYLGQEILNSSMGFDQLVVETYGLSYAQRAEDVPISFMGDALEWAYMFEVQHAGPLIVNIDSADISDLDLYLFYLGPTGDSTPQQRSSSATATSVESITYMMPEDGVWAVAVDNYSGPAGHFDLSLLVIEGYDVEASGYPTGPVPANTDVAVDLSYSGPEYLGDIPPMLMGSALPTGAPPSGTWYHGFVTLGPLESPALASALINVVRLPDPTVASLKVDRERFCPGYSLEYTLTLTNTSDIALADVAITDTLPAKVSFISASGSAGLASTYDGTTGVVNWTQAPWLPGEVLTAKVKLHTFSSLATGYEIENTFVYNAMAPGLLTVPVNHEQIGPLEVSITSVADRTLCGVTPTPTAEPTATPTLTPVPEYRLMLPLISRVAPIF